MRLDKKPEVLLGLGLGLGLGHRSYGVVFLKTFFLNFPPAPPLYPSLARIKGMFGAKCWSIQNRSGTNYKCRFHIGTASRDSEETSFPDECASRTNEEQRNTGASEPNTNDGWNLANISAAEISDLETMLEQKTFTRYEIERLTRLGEGDKAIISNDSHVLRLKASTSGPLNKNAEERENLHAVISTPRAFEEGVASPAGKRRSSVLDDRRPRRRSVLDDLGSGGPMRRIRQKVDLCSQGSSLSKHEREFDSSAIVENGETRMRNSGYGFVPIESTQMASKILEHLERTSPKEKPSSSRLARTTEKSATKLTSNLAHKSLNKVESSKFLLSSHNNQKSEGQHRIEENGPQRFAVPLNVLSSMNGNSTAPIQVAPTTNAASTLALPAETQKKPAFRMRVPQVHDSESLRNLFFGFLHLKILRCLMLTTILQYRILRSLTTAKLVQRAPFVSKRITRSSICVEINMKRASLDVRMTGSSYPSSSHYAGDFGRP
nr:hypothetical protein [Tanacetum cinerariifolium]